MDRKIIGESGELQALHYLKKNGFQILERNYRYRKAEIDIICSKGQTLIFVEVKKRKNSTYGHPETFVSANQQKQIINAADHYLYAIDWHHNIRYDIIAITGDQLYHIRDAFY
ncbi:MAG: YraN family protein [Bacteroidota bacterium]